MDKTQNIRRNLQEQLSGNRQLQDLKCNRR